MKTIRHQQPAAVHYEDNKTQAAISNEGNTTSRSRQPSIMKTIQQVEAKSRL